ncbi:hypothetical protein F5Y16DRAFT_399529 [Xylariaceae sp. FL0255]|nr:hypothetical protein F5Y16DRAFT_399529 [Xylariaceae sp. FL0255]
MATLGVNKEARAEALRYFDLLSTLDFPIFFTQADRDRHTGRSRMFYGQPRSCILAIDWKTDLFHLSGHPNIVMEHPLLPVKVTRLAIDLSLFYYPDFEAGAPQPEWIENLPRSFPSLTHLTMALDCRLESVCQSLCDYDVITPLKHVHMNEYYFSPSPREEVQKWILRIVAQGFANQDDVEITAEIIDYCHNICRNVEDQIEEIRDTILALMPWVEVESAADTTVLYLWE